MTQASLDMLFLPRLCVLQEEFNAVPVMLHNYNYTAAIIRIQVAAAAEIKLANNFAIHLYTKHWQGILKINGCDEIVKKTNKQRQPGRPHQSDRVYIKFCSSNFCTPIWHVAPPTVTVLYV